MTLLAEDVVTSKLSVACAEPAIPRDSRLKASDAFFIIAPIFTIKHEYRLIQTFLAFQHSKRMLIQSQYFQEYEKNPLSSMVSRAFLSTHLNP
jgi:hypothetical protein